MFFIVSGLVATAIAASWEILSVMGIVVVVTGGIVDELVVGACVVCGGRDVVVVVGTGRARMVLVVVEVEVVVVGTSIGTGSVVVVG